MAEWRRNNGDRQWELGYYNDDDIFRQRWIRAGYVTDEFLERTALSPERLAAYVWERFGSVPPPLAVHLPPEPPVVFTWGPR